MDNSSFPRLLITYILNRERELESERVRDWESERVRELESENVIQNWQQSKMET